MLARALRAAQIIVPFAAGWLAIRLLKSFFAGVDGGGLFGGFLWILQAIVVATVVSAGVTRLMKRFTPLVALLNMSLVFPDSTPSRFGLALRSGNIKKLMAEPTLQLSSSTQEAAEQAVQLMGQLAKHEPLTRGHTERVRAYADVIGQQMGLSDADLNGLRWGALLHDVGKLTVPSELLSKAGKPTVQEWEIIRGHPAAAVPILKPLHGWLGDWLLAAPEHHERFDGTGYPNGLTGHQISLAGRITAVADAYDVITSRRSYKAPKSAEFAREEMVRSAGSHFDPMVVRALLEAGVTKTAYARRMGWVLELPGIARALTTAGQAVTTTAVAVAVSVAPVIAPTISDTPSVSDESAIAAAPFDTAPDGLGFVEEDSTSIEAPTDEEQPRPVPANPSPTSSGVSEVPESQENEGTTSNTAPETSTDSTVVDPSLTTTPDLPEAVGSPTTVAQRSPATEVPRSTTTTQAPKGPLVAPTTPTTRAPATTTPTTRAPTADCLAVRDGATFIVTPNLRDCDLSGLTLQGWSFEGADLRDANLSGLTLTGFNLRGADLTGANLTLAKFTDGSLAGADLTDVTAEEVRLTNVGVGAEVNEGQPERSWPAATVTRTNFSDATFTNMSFLQVELRTTNLLDITFINSDFKSANLRDVDLSGTDLSGTDFSGALIDGVNFARTNLSDTRFVQAVGVPGNTSGATFVNITCPNSTTQQSSCW